MTAALLARERQTHPGLRPIDPRRDLAAVARLIEQAFAGRLDGNGQRMLREMRLVGSLGWLGRLAGWLLIPSMTPALGFVWVESEHVVGNASLLRIDGYPERWVLANVAVEPGYRRQGIARRLVGACLGLAERRGGRSVVLQVDRDELGAQALYRSFGFQVLTTRTTWVRDPGGRPFGSNMGVKARPRRADEWREQAALASRVHPEGLIWPFPAHAGLFATPSFPGKLVGTARTHWVWPAEGPLQASLSVRPAVERRGWRWVLVLDPAARGQAEAPLLSAALAEIEARRRPVVVDVVPGPADPLLIAMGFRAERTLTWMGLELRAKGM